jgi:hypothetical protein
MRKVTLSIGLAAAIVTFSPASRAQALPKSNSNASFDSHDLSGMWDFFNRGVDGQGIYATISKTPPPLTEWGKARYAEARPEYGPKAAIAGNDPITQCVPTGIPRVMFYPQPHEIVQAPDRVFMFFEREHAFRQIWTDGRQHPKDLDPTYMGDSIGWWDGDTFVVDTVGFNENKNWIDFFGDPHSDQLHLIERYKRVDHDTLTMQLIVDDPKACTQTWVGDTKIFKLLPPKDAYMEELFCVWSEENSFTNRIRMTSAGKSAEGQKTQSAAPAAGDAKPKK